MTSKEILVVNPHLDDGFLFASGYMKRMKDQGANITNVLFTTKSSIDGIDDKQYEEEFNKASNMFSSNNWVFDMEDKLLNKDRQKILDILVEFSDNEYDMVICPGSKDLHQDHRTVFEECFRCFKRLTTIIGYNAPWNCREMPMDMIVEIDWEHKESVLRQFKSQITKKYMELKYNKSIAIATGTLIDVQFAESFEVIRWIVKD